MLQIVRTARGRAALAAVAVGLGVMPAVAGAGHASADGGQPDGANNAAPTATPIKHLVVLFDENVSFDHYFGTYPKAANPSGEPGFKAAAGTPTVNGLSGGLLTRNPNLSNPQRLDRSQAVTCDQDHGYTSEQKAFDTGAMDQFVQNTGAGKTAQACTGKETGTTPDYAVMDYYDGNTVTALWNYAQNFSLSDNSYGTTFGPSTPGAINVTAGNTYGALCGPASAVYQAPACTSAPGSAAATPATPAAQGPGTDYSDADPNYDVCSQTEDKASAATTIQMGGRNVGDLLNKAGVSWGWFEGGFASPGYVPGKPSTDDLSAVCTGTTTNIAGKAVKDYIPHHEPFQYYGSTANPQHLPPQSVTAIGGQDQANHQYDLRDFWAAVDGGDMPAVSFLKAPAAQDGHAGYSDPLDEQKFLVDTINRLEQSPDWKSTAVVINWDDSDGWYDHQMGPITTQSQTPLDALTGAGQCGAQTSQVPSGQQARCGVGPRIPLLVVSPFARTDFVDHTFTTQTSVVSFIEDNWLGGGRIGGGSADAWSGGLGQMLDFAHPGAAPLFLDPSTGEPTSRGQADS